MGHRSAADQRQAAGLGRSQGIHRHGGGGGGARGGQPGGIAEQQGLAGLHRHQQGPGGDQRALFANDVGRSLDSVDLFLGEHAEVVDEVAATGGELHQLLGRLERLAGGQVEEQLAHGLEDVDTGEQLLGFGLLDDQGSGGAHAISGMDVNNLSILDFKVLPGKRRPASMTDGGTCVSQKRKRRSRMASPFFSMPAFSACAVPA